MQLTPRIQKLHRNPKIADFAAILGVAYFISQVRFFADRLPSVIDEGMYLYKGYIFALGRYSPFQDYGPWTDHMPLSFLIPGYVQQIFGPGLRTGRYYAIMLAFLMIVGLWIVVHRLGGKWWAALAVWVYALNIAQIQIYSAAASQVLIAALTIWVLVFCLGDNRPTWQIAAATLLATIAFLSRINMLPLPIFLLIYIYFQKGRKTALMCAGLSAGIIVFVHAAYWPEILKIWATVTPGPISPFLDSWREPLGAEKSYAPPFSIIHRISSMLIALRYHFISIFSLVFAWLAWERLRKTDTGKTFNQYVFLLFLFIVLVLAHGIITILFNYCVFCLPNYLSFFGGIGIILLVISFPHLPFAPSRTKQKVTIGIVMFLLIGVLIGAQGSIMPIIFDFLFKMENAFNLSLNRRILLSSFAIFVILAPTIFLALIYAFKKVLMKNRPDDLFNYSKSVLISTLGLSVMLSTTGIFSGNTGTNICDESVIGSYERVGRHLRDVIPEDATVFWRAGNPAPLLYIPETNIFPAQLSGAYSYKIGGEPSELEAFGYWNAEMGTEWAMAADFLVVDRNIAGLPFRINLDNFIELETVTANLNCMQDSSIEIYQRIR